VRASTTAAANGSFHGHIRLPNKHCEFQSFSCRSRISDTSAVAVAEEVRRERSRPALQPVSRDGLRRPTSKEGFERGHCQSPEGPSVRKGKLERLAIDPMLGACASLPRTLYRNSQRGFAARRIGRMTTFGSQPFGAAIIASRRRNGRIVDLLSRERE
jgi:hypothetical protein